MSTIRVLLVLGIGLIALNCAKKEPVADTTAPATAPTLPPVVPPPVTRSTVPGELSDEQRQKLLTDRRANAKLREQQKQPRAPRPRRTTTAPATSSTAPATLQ